jgi:hypothetical protein
MLYLRCFTSNAKILGEIIDILNYNKIIRKIMVILIRIQLYSILYNYA